MRHSLGLLARSINACGLVWPWYWISSHYYRRSADDDDDDGVGCGIMETFNQMSLRWLMLSFCITHDDDRYRRI